MLKFCKSSGEMREVIDVTMAKAKLKPDVVMYNTLVGTLRMEGDDVATESVVEEMKKAGVEPEKKCPQRGRYEPDERTGASAKPHAQYSN
jgi:pentatricopeptide repeat protein